MTKASMLELSPISEGESVKNALEATINIAREAENLGFYRFWIAEHHNIPTIASASNTVIIGQVLAATRKIKVGAGGVMLPNHPPLVVAEQYGTLAQFYPHRVDLGIGRAPGSDINTVRALGSLRKSAIDFSSEVSELLRYLKGGQGDVVKAIPAQNTTVPVWILGTSLFGAELAAKLGLPYVFASHFAPKMLEDAIHVYRSNFTPSVYLSEPYFMMSVGFYAADTDEEARRISSSIKLHFAELQRGNIGKLAAPIHDIENYLDADMLESVESNMSCSAIGSLQTVTERLSEIINKYQPEEIMISSMIHNPVSRIHSLNIAANAFRNIGVSMGNGD